MSFEPLDVSYFKQLLDNEMIEVKLWASSGVYCVNDYMEMHNISYIETLTIHIPHAKYVEKMIDVCSIYYYDNVNFIHRHCNVLSSTTGDSVLARDVVNALLLHGEVQKYVAIQCSCNTCNTAWKHICSLEIFQSLIDYKFSRYLNGTVMCKEYYISGCGYVHSFPGCYVFKRCESYNFDYDVRTVEHYLYYTKYFCERKCHRTDGPDFIERDGQGRVTDCEFHIRNKRIL